MKNTNSKRPFIPHYVYDLDLSINELMFYLWGRSQTDPNFRFSDRGAAAQLNCHPNTIKNLRESLVSKWLMSCGEQSRVNGKFGASKWIFYEKPTPPESLTTKNVQNTPNEDYDNGLPF